ncbi:OmpH family outer membrane protein [Thiomicrospira sp. ALE5]|uniref:OmpH family outer membrane protein n=1 Tax=Thiomicrospira sp. ALE5 TaxID=748650 RepID=UPI0008ED8F52|nr:OmpH family outer membrane protein [Thiomicrospira sp. ALE5]SFR48971.1 periplasmic chaperone for outer membrane proteins Skp [Thiomicrospira sp. ALE5]
MRRWLAISFIAGFLGLQSLPLVAQTGAVKVGVVNVAVLLEQSPQAKRASASLESEFSSQQQELIELNNKMEQKQRGFNRDQLAMTESQQNLREREIAILGREIQRKRNDVQELLNIRRNEELAKLQNVVNDAIREVGQREGFDLILYEGIAFTSARVDLTQQVLSYMTELHDRSSTEFNR